MQIRHLIHRFLATSLVLFALSGLSAARPAMGTSAAPTVDWNTFEGAANNDSGNDIAVDNAGNLYVVGTQDNLTSKDAFVTKLNASGVTQWKTVLGGVGDDYGNGVAVDGSGNVYVVGTSANKDLQDASWGTPIRPFDNPLDTFVAKLGGGGNLMWNTFMGVEDPVEDPSGIYQKYGSGIAVDGDGNSYITGKGLTWASPPRHWQAYVARFGNNGARAWRTLLGAPGQFGMLYQTDAGNDVAVDGSGSAYVTGSSDASWGSPLNPYAGQVDAFVAKLNNAGSLVWNTFLGSAQNDAGYGIAQDGSGNIYLAGSSRASWGTPVAPYQGAYDAFAAKLNPSGALQWNTFMGSTADDWGNDVAVNTGGLASVAGTSNATWGSLPNSAQAAGGAFLAHLGTGGALSWNTFLGSGSPESGTGVAMRPGYFYAGGTSTQTWGTPVNLYAGGTDAFAARLSIPNTPPVAVGDSYVVKKSTALSPAVGVLANDTDSDGDPLTAIKESDPAHGGLTFNADGSFTYTPIVGYVGADSFHYKANDGRADSNVAAVNITVYDYQIHLPLVLRNAP